MAVSNRDASSQPSRPAEGSNGLEVSTLVITAIASAGAALVSSELLGAGTLVSAALTPVVIALLKEALDRPRRVVSTVVPAAVSRPRRRRAAPGPAGSAADSAWDPPPARDDTGEVHIYRSTGRRWRLAVLTGLLGFVLAAGGSVGGGSRATTYFGGGDASPRAGDSDRREDGGRPDGEREDDPAGPAPARTAPDPAATTPEAPDAPEDGTPEAPPSTAPDPAAPTPPAQSSPAPAPDPAAPAPEAPAAPPAPGP